MNVAQNSTVKKKVLLKVERQEWEKGNKKAQGSHISSGISSEPAPPVPRTALLPCFRKDTVGVEKVELSMRWAVSYNLHAGTDQQTLQFE